MKKFNVVLLGAALLLTACGGAKETSTEADVVKIGGIGPLTGPLAIYGVTSTNGSKLAMEEINKNGGILGKQVEYIVLDEKGDSTEAVTAYNKLVDEGVVALIGDITSKPSLAVAEVAAQDNMPMITPTGTQFNITEAGPNVFRVCFTDPYQGVVLANFAKNNLNAETVAVVVNNSNDYSDGVAKAFIEQAEKLGLKVVAKEGYSDGDKDFRAQLTKILPTNPDVLVVPDYYEQVALITTQAREVGIKATFVGPDGWDGVAKTLDPSAYGAIENSYFTNHYSLQDQSEKVQNFLKAYKEAYNEEPSAFSALSYDAAYMVKAAIEKAGTTEKQAVVDALKSLDYSGVTGHLTFDEKNNPVKAVTVLKIVNGEYTFDSVVEPAK
ncbi:ABC transporter substrate-binding protein [Fusobacterium perfoetens]|uniref:ABC transporter substrate-binding protein n=1 Tax=Fusobacterium perfoetens TaxID=852 RepID=UPI0015A04D44|nr:ABC transporter substrate-binding protein [Fusobacterium perfoetens]MCF2625476.1 ABC transporter substrate-binding protein [Fusobacterium perfoetens]